MRFFVVAMALLACSASALAQTQPFTRSILAVTKCDPRANVSTTYPLQTGLSRCIALRVTFADGTHLRNPNLPHLRRQLYEVHE